jgi:hypothetical protein
VQLLATKRLRFGAVSYYEYEIVNGHPQRSHGKDATLYSDLKKVHADGGYCSLLALKDCIEEKGELFAPVPERKGSQGRRTDSGKFKLLRTSLLGRSRPVHSAAQSGI